MHLLQRVICSSKQSSSSRADQLMKPREATVANNGLWETMDLQGYLMPFAHPCQSTALFSHFCLLTGQASFSCSLIFGKEELGESRQGRPVPEAN